MAAFFLVFAAYARAEVQTVEIKSARTTQYDKDESGGETVRFSGDVVIVVTKGNSISKISADEIVYDKERDTLEATGRVTYEHTTGKVGGETFEGDAFLFDLKNQEGVFLGGRIQQDSGSKDNDPYIVHAEITGKDSSSTMAFKNGMLTTCDADDPHWSINATRIWLLPGNEIALLNGVFFIGPLPVFYIPFFYYPSDEMIVHPVFGFRNREGYFVQTTTYLLGRKPLPAKTDTSGGKSFANFLQGDTLKEQKRNGVFLENTDEDAKSADSDYLKIVGDAYSTLGYLVGIDGAFTPDTVWRDISFYGYLGFSRTLYPPYKGLLYSSYDAAGAQNADSGWFFGNELPFRFRAGLSTKVDKAPFSFAINVPLVSDPYFKPDFMDRSEDLNWMKFLTDYDELALGNNLGAETSYSWNVTGSYAPKLSLTVPYLETASIKSLSGTMTFGSMNTATLSEDATKYSPERKFFFPERIKPELSLSFSGTLLTSEDVARKPKESKKADTTGLENPFDSPAGGDGKNADQDESLARFMPSPVLVPSASIPVRESTWSVSWSLSPSVVEEITYDNSKLKGPEDVDLNDYSLIFLNQKANADLVGAWSYDTDFLSISSSLNYSGSRQSHPFFSDTYYTQSKIADIKLTDYRTSIFTVSNSNKVSFLPFNRNDLLRPMSLEWNLSDKLLQSRFDGTVDDPSRELRTIEWDKEFITSHTATTVAGVSVFDKTEKITLTSNLPPLLGSYSYDASLGVAFVDATLSTRLFEKENDRKKWFWDPFKASLSWTLPLGITLSQSYTYDLEEKEHTQLVFKAKMGFFSSEYSINNTVRYKLVEGAGWKLDGTDKHFIPTAFTVFFNNSSKKLQFYEWKNRVYLDGTLDSNLRFDLLRPTSSSFSFSPGVVLKIHEFMDITFSSTSTNEVLARYFQDWIDLPAPLPGETNIAADLVNSFCFYDQAVMRSSGFKLKKLNLGITHYLHDWTAKFNTTIEPVLKKDGAYHYEFSPSITFIVEWKPISDIKTTVKSKEGAFTLNTTDKEAK